MNPILHALPLDWSGESLDNRTKGERHDLTDQSDLPFRIAVLRNGYFFTDTMYIIDGNGKELKEGIDYQCIGFLSDAVDKTAKTVCSVIVITNPKVGYVIEVDAQMVGGPYCSVGKSIIEAAKGLQNSTRKIHWNNITGKPDDFTPNGHLHALWELFGFTPQVLQLQRMTRGFEASVQKDFDALMAKFNQDMTAMEKLLDEVDAQLTAHINDKTTNPHRETKGNLVPSLALVQNEPKATQAEASNPSGAILNRYATPYSLSVAISVNFTSKLNEHVQARNNPHRVTAAQLSTYTIAEYNALVPSYVPLNSTTLQSNRIYGYTPTEWYNAMRVNNDVGNLSNASGRLGVGRFTRTEGWPGRQYYLAPDLNWYPIQDQFKKHEVVPTKVVPLFGYTTSSDAGKVALANSLLADNTVYPPGTIAIMRMPITRYIATGNGGDVATTTQNIGMCVKNAAGVFVNTTGPA
ncbi:virion structural protein [Pseudomonas phage D6]|nr:virion structural protein [Pseudomonas phage D6]